MHLSKKMQVKIIRVLPIIIVCYVSHGEAKHRGIQKHLHGTPQLPDAMRGKGFVDQHPDEEEEVNNKILKSYYGVNQSTKPIANYPTNDNHGEIMMAGIKKYNLGDGNTNNKSKNGKNTHLSHRNHNDKSTKVKHFSDKSQVMTKMTTSQERHPEEIDRMIIKMTLRRLFGDRQNAQKRQRRDTRNNDQSAQEVAPTFLKEKGTKSPTFQRHVFLSKLRNIVEHFETSIDSFMGMPQHKAKLLKTTDKGHTSDRDYNGSDKYATGLTNNIMSPTPRPSSMNHEEKQISDYVSDSDKNAPNASIPPKYKNITHEDVLKLPAFKEALHKIRNLLKHALLIELHENNKNKVKEDVRKSMTTRTQNTPGQSADNHEPADNETPYKSLTFTTLQRAAYRNLAEQPRTSDILRDFLDSISSFSTNSGQRMHSTILAERLYNYYSKLRFGGPIQQFNEDIEAMNETLNTMLLEFVRSVIDREYRVKKLASKELEVKKESKETEYSYNDEPKSRDNNREKLNIDFTDAVGRGKLIRKDTVWMRPIQYLPGVGAHSGYERKMDLLLQDPKDRAKQLDYSIQPLTYDQKGKIAYVSNKFGLRRNTIHSTIGHMPGKSKCETEDIDSIPQKGGKQSFSQKSTRLPKLASVRSDGVGKYKTGHYYGIMRNTVKQRISFLPTTRNELRIGFQNSRTTTRQGDKILNFYIYL